MCERQQVVSPHLLVMEMISLNELYQKDQITLTQNEENRSKVKKEDNLLMLP
jgi:hypothetical protein